MAPKTGSAVSRSRPNEEESVLNRRQFIIGTALVLAACSAPAAAAMARVYKTASCSCCAAWVDYLRANGFEVGVTDVPDLAPVARRLRVPDAMRACHTAEVGPYFVEGHVPAADIHKLLKERPVARGISVPGMPLGTPGMEQGMRQESFVTLLVERDGGIRLFVDHSA